MSVPVLVHDVVQLDPKLDRFGACFMLVTEVRSWGLIGFVRIPNGGDAYYRVSHGDYEYVGPAVFVPADEILP